jgi:CheY-like chemotaxis protein
MTRRHGGLGLGLAIARDLAELHGGSVLADSQGLGKGATFTVVLPRQVAQHAVQPETASSQANVLEGVSVLVVDDDQDTRDVLREAVRAAGGAVETAGSGEAALTALKDRPVDLILCDLAMPGMDGYELMRRIRAIGSRGNGPAAVAVSAHAGTLAEARAREAGFQSFVAKPYSTDKLFEAIAEARRSYLKPR